MLKNMCWEYIRDKYIKNKYKDLMNFNQSVIKNMKIKKIYKNVCWEYKRKKNIKNKCKKYMNLIRML